MDGNNTFVGAGFGLPLGNVTSQLFANIFLSSFDHFVKEKLRMRWYIRFCDDFMIAHPDRDALVTILPHIRDFLHERCGLSLHPKKVMIRTYWQEIDVLGTVLRPYTETIRTNTKRRMFRRLRNAIWGYHVGTDTSEQLRATLQSYRGLLTHGNIREQVRVETLEVFMSR